MDAVADNANDAKVIYIDIESKYAQYVQLSVTDSGPGISPERIKSIFHAFSTTKATGMGMGLTISRAIIEAHGGQLWARPGNRGLLSFALPLKETNDE
jgi:two-component system sensor kinase FixL